MVKQFFILFNKHMGVKLLVQQFHPASVYIRNYFSLINKAGFFPKLIIVFLNLGKLQKLTLNAHKTLLVGPLIL